MTVNITERVRKADNLPSLPRVAMEVLRLLQDTGVSVPALAKVIQQDPALTSRLLRVANSSLFGMPRRIASLQQAMIALGLRTVKVMVLGFSLVDTMGRNTGTQFDFSAFWRRSLTTAVACRLLGEKVCRSSSDEAFITGLLCDLGVIAAFECAKDLYIPVVSRQSSTHEPLCDVEREILGTTHEALGNTLLSHWSLPQSLCAAVNSHHAPLEADVNDEGANPLLTRVVRSAAAIAAVFCGDNDPGALQELTQRVPQALPVTPEQLKDILDALDQHVCETASLFALNIGTTRSHEDIKAEAAAQLANLSTASELERIGMAQPEPAAQRTTERPISQNNKPAQEALSDALTGIANRAAFDRRIAQECAKASSHGTAVGLLFLDADNFKKLDDTFGHQTGDDALRAIAGCLRDISSEFVYAARYGGEEFAVVLTAPSGEQEVRTLGETLRAKIEATKITYGIRKISISVSLGGVVMSGNNPQLSPAALIKLADKCLYAAKEAGRNRVVVGDPCGTPARPATAMA